MHTIKFNKFHRFFTDEVLSKMHVYIKGSVLIKKKTKKKMKLHDF